MAVPAWIERRRAAWRQQWELDWLPRLIVAVVGLGCVASVVVAAKDRNPHVALLCCAFFCAVGLLCALLHLSNTRQGTHTEEVDLPVGHARAFDRAREALRALPGLAIRKEDRARGRLLARRPGLWIPGDVILVEIESNGPGSHVRISAIPVGRAGRAGVRTQLAEQARALAGRLLEAQTVAV